jgi:pyrroloquinoline-quinone synthase
MEISAFWLQVEQELAKHDLLRHPFYQAWSNGELTTEDLKFYAEQYYHHVSSFPTYLTALHSRLPEGPMRREVLANAFDEECGGVAGTCTGEGMPEFACSHAELWSWFAEGMGGEASKLDANAPIAEMSDLVCTFRAIAQEAPVAAAFGALFAYESQVPRIAGEKRNGLQRHYGASDRTCSYFTLHQTADIHHSNVWRNIISGLVEKDERRAGEALEGVSRAARALWTALDGIERDRPNHKAGSCAAAVVN